MPQPTKPLKTPQPKKINPPKTDWGKRLFDRTIGDPNGWLIIGFAFFSLYMLWEALLGG